MPDSVNTQNSVAMTTPNAPVVIVKDGVPVADSRDVATAFGKQHKNVLQKVDALIAEAPELNGLNFKPVISADSKGEMRRSYEMDETGFSLVAMRFTGTKALQWQIAYANEFQRMRDAVHSGSGSAVVDHLDPSVMRAIGGMMKGIVQKQLAEIVPALVNERIMSGRLTVVEGVCAVEVVEMAGYRTGQRPRGVSQFATRRLARFHEDRGVPIRRDRRGIIKARLFDEVTARQWLAAGGKTEIDHYIAGRKGQGALKLVSGT